ncbi:AbrB/MazE/SpoVT family DNA-binding domain-containing protein [Lysinibacillus sp. OL1]|uniref:AbrB/MazE/SpoVT family DNA-binding domain-containing protein n=1 Tax=Lysinibacillus sp. OL1 TaxID=2517243 RepID=UPI00187D6A2B
MTDKGQVTIPSKIRDDLKLETGDFLIFSFVNESIFIRKEGQMVPCCACNATGQYEDYG